MIHANCTGSHRVYKFFVPRHIDETNDFFGLIRGVSKTQLNGHPPGFLFRQPIGIDPRQRLDQRGFPMIDMAGSTNDHCLDPEKIVTLQSPFKVQPPNSQLRLTNVRLISALYQSLNNVNLAARFCLRVGQSRPWAKRVANAQDAPQSFREP